MKLYAAITLLLMLGACRIGTNDQIDDDAKRAVEAFGFSDVQMEGGYQFGGWINNCDNGDSYARPFIAKNAQGRSVRGTACAGFFKSWTVRLSS